MSPRRFPVLARAALLLVGSMLVHAIGGACGSAGAGEEPTVVTAVCDGKGDATTGKGSKAIAKFEGRSAEELMGVHVGQARAEGGFRAIPRELIVTDGLVTIESCGGTDVRWTVMLR